MLAAVSFLAVIAISLLVVRVATVALTLTGLSTPLARFQARSAFTGAGFTTAESEKVVQHPVRRRIIMLLMLMGNAGIVTAVSSLLLSFTGADAPRATAERFLLLFAGVGLLWWAAMSAWVDGRMSALIGWALRRFTSVDARDYAGLLHLTGDYVVAELSVEEDDWLAGGSLKSLRLNSEGLLVLGIERGEGDYLGAPRGAATLRPGDTVLLYGRRAIIEELDERRRDSRGAWEHVRNVEQQKAIEVEERDAQQEASATAA